jgi:hypothetical protein
VTRVRDNIRAYVDGTKSTIRKKLKKPTNVLAWEHDVRVLGETADPSQSLPARPVGGWVLRLVTLVPLQIARAVKGQFEVLQDGREGEASEPLLARPPML